jgi:Dolichyl-phosphate-mannose-protein mannosyltransferase
MRIAAIQHILPALAIFLTLCLYQLELPGLYYDEALDLTPMLTWLHGGPPELLRGVGLGSLPVMLLDYMGSLGGYVTLPFMAIWGSGYAAARLQPILFSSLTIVLVFLQARRWFGTSVAVLTTLLLSVQPSYVWFSRQGISVTSVMTVFAWASLLFLPVAGAQHVAGLRRTGRRWLMTGVMLGLGLWAKLPFLWWLMMLAMMTTLYFAQRARAYGIGAVRRDPVWRGMLPLAAGFAFGAAPLIYYNMVGLLREGTPYTLALIFGSLFKPTQQFGVDNLDFMTNLGTSWSNFKVFIDGSYFWYNGVTYSNVYALPALMIALVLGAALAPRRPERWRWLAVALALPVAVFMGSFTVSGQWATHFFIISGLPQLILACGAVWAGEWLAGEIRKTADGDISLVPRPLSSAFNSPSSVSRLLPIAIAALLLALPFSRDVWVSQQHHQKLAQTGGSGRFSDAVYKIAAYLDGRDGPQPVALDWGIEKQIRVLTGDRVRLIEVFGYSAEPDDAFRARTRELLQDPDRTYIVLWDRFAVYNRRSEFTRLANEMGKQVTETFIAHERSGLPVYVVLEAK